MATRKFKASAHHLKRLVSRPDAWSGDVSASRLSRVPGRELWDRGLSRKTVKCVTGRDIPLGHQKASFETNYFSF